MTGKPNLTDELDALLGKSRTGPCKVCALPPELKDIISARVDSGIRAWTAYVRFLKSHGHEISRDRVQYHFDRHNG